MSGLAIVTFLLLFVVAAVMTGDDNGFFRLILSLVLILGIIAATCTWLGFTIQCLWGWYVVPLGIQDISLTQAIGLGILGRAFTGPVTAGAIWARGPQPGNKLEETMVEPVVWLILASWLFPGCLLVVGYFNHLI